MNILKIRDDKGFYSLNDGENTQVDKLNKEGLLKLLDFAIKEDFTMDEMSDENIKNKAHRIIYKNLYDKFTELKENKKRFRDESESLYKDAIEKYTTSIETTS